MLSVVQPQFLSGHGTSMQQGGRDDGQSSPTVADSSCLEAGFDGPVVQGFGELGAVRSLPDGNDRNGHLSHLGQKSPRISRIDHVLKSR